MENERVREISGFMLVELILGLAVMTILSGVTLWSGKRLFVRAYIEHDKMTLRQLVSAYERVRANCDYSSFGMRDLIVHLAKDEALNDVRYYHSIKRQKGWGQKIINDNGKVLIKDLLPDWIFILHLPSDVSLNGMVPVLYSYGLREDGTWSDDSPYGAKGGLIAFANGEVFFVENAKIVLRSYETGEPVENIMEALPKGAKLGRFVEFGE